ncbi:helix-turn-helix domain-containing protein [Cryobacterium sp. SO2]|uniref:helix-turn-helix domain-containing protein n=1 Tax=Cryobacterium sp. SO2 TaxID=1897060 RepID=UPI00223D257A|nr:helix-turn-helix domain-containing protein [Cryobacterium sp. SO2]WEO78615.1 helix-turn-helix domain-containing protein [Cryobacterium sp. SO2]
MGAAAKPMAVVVRALDTLTCLAGHPQGLTIQQLHHTLGIPLASMHRMLATLEHEEFISRCRVSKRYVLGTAARSLTQPLTQEPVPEGRPVASPAGQTGPTP